MQYLVDRGYVGTKFQVESSVRSSLKNIARQALCQQSKQTYLNARVGFPIDPWTINSEHWRAIFPKSGRVQLILRNYLDGDPELLRVEVIDVPPKAPRQNIHRDHDIGARKSVCVAVNLSEGQDVGTLLLPGSQLTDDVASEEDPVVSSCGDLIIYDTYCIHAGASNPTSHHVSGRLFFTFRAPGDKLTKKDKTHLTRSLAQSATSLHAPIPLSELTTAGRHTQANK
jgi:ectoine hydroxylase-related dioxygenase (phytanoyl-CoA dioxygenase family)